MGHGYPRVSLFGLPARPGTATGYARLLPLPGVPTLIGLRLAVPGGVRACFSSLNVGSFHDVGAG